MGKRLRLGIHMPDVPLWCPPYGVIAVVLGEMRLHRKSARSSYRLLTAERCLIATLKLYKPVSGNVITAILIAAKTQKQVAVLPQPQILNADVAHQPAIRSIRGHQYHGVVAIIAYQSVRGTNPYISLRILYYTPHVVCTKSVH